MRNCAVIGCGWAGKHHLDAIRESGCARLAAAAEPDPGRREWIAKAYGVPVYEDLEDLLARQPFDTAVVATLPTLHFAQCQALIRAGKHVLCEKPVCRSSREIRLLMEEARAAGVRFGVVFNQRYGEMVKKLEEMLQKDSTPRHLACASMYQDFPKHTGGHIDETFLLTDSCCHLLDLLTYLCGPVEQVRALGAKTASEPYSDVAVALRFRGGCVGAMTHTTVGGRLDTQHPFQRIDIHTGLGRYCLESLGARLTFYPHGREAREVMEPSVFARENYAASLREACKAYLEAVDTGEPLPADLTDALENMLVIEAMIASLREK
ncbi:MAG: Gfo/Idh/MocA family oxidoreductase [Candidatus Limiplasma sp.]|nr:Gfo/Idh/MocA family oxidoreductase [Candidatus Limiplasma sp.]